MGFFAFLKAPAPPDRAGALRRTEQISAVTHVISSLEYLTCPEDREEGGLNHWEIARDDHLSDPQWRRNLMDFMARKPVTEGMHVARVLAGLLLVSGAGGRRARGAANGLLALTSLLQYSRHRFGTDGSDQLSLLVQAACGIARSAESDPRVVDACLWFLAQQSALSYTVSGAVKLASPTWRSGDALPGVMRTRTYGHKGMWEFTQANPGLSKFLVKGTLALEAGFLAAFLRGGRAVRPVLAGTAAFHAANALFMGLGRFVWAFVSTYPAVRYCVGSGDKR